MKEVYDLGLEKSAHHLFPSPEGSFIGDLCYVKIDSTDPRLQILTELDDESRAQNGFGIVVGWRIKRSNSRSEIESADLFEFLPTKFFEPTGEECGTDYDVSNICPICGAGRIQRSSLRLNLRKLPKRGGFAMSIANELVVSHSVAELLVKHSVTGIDLRPVGHRSEPDAVPDLESASAGRELVAKANDIGLSKNTGEFQVWIHGEEQKPLLDKFRMQTGSGSDTTQRSQLPVWYQIIPKSRPVSLVPPTRFGNDPFDADLLGEFRCPRGHTSGLQVLSELWVDRSSWDGADFCVTRELISYHPPDSLLYPVPLILISPRLRAVLKESMIKGFNTEVAHLV